MTDHGNNFMQKKIVTTQPAPREKQTDFKKYKMPLVEDE
jgi:hypothetical protein